MSVGGNEIVYVCSGCKAREKGVSEPSNAPEGFERPELGQVVFDAYAASVGGLTWDGKPIPKWLEVTEKVREGWRDAAEALERELAEAVGAALDVSRNALNRRRG